jgi:hypothetical protein
MANSYRCYFTDESDRIRSFEQIECSDDAAALLKADELLAKSKCSTAELWQGKRLVGKWGTDSHAVGVKQDRGIEADPNRPQSSTFSS